MCKKIAGLFQRIRTGAHNAAHMLKEQAGQIAYYACVALVLTAVAAAAERYRSNDEHKKDEPIIPAAELSVYSQEEEKTLFTLPEGMEEVRAFSDLPEWNAVHGQWETHTAVDYTCAGNDVISVSDGTVRTVGKSGIYGGFIEIETGDYLIRYASIETGKDLFPGEEIRMGEKIGETGISLPGEAGMDAHLHLEIVQNGRYLDFSDVCSTAILRLD